ncbi:MAG: intradiol ring-cleavage dioxygenase [Anaerolineales bacterium]|nr:intradiol ring-cleavage dioxygenase [Anaerolineales bacterium]
MDNDDKLIGQILSRREALRILGLGGAATLLASCAPNITETFAPTISSTTAPITEAVANGTSAVLPMCIVRPEMTEGPYFVDEMLQRSDIRADASTGIVSEGAPLELTFNVTQVGANGCTVLPNAQVDIWHCDAYGVYSDVENAVGKTFLRGYQVTDANGMAKFTSIYPGWYSGRAVHIHFKIRYDHQEFISQLFFDDAFTDKVYAQEPYVQKGIQDTLNSQDAIYSHGGQSLLLNVAPSGGGYSASFNIGMQI